MVLARMMVVAVRSIVETSQISTQGSLLRLATVAPLAAIRVPQVAMAPDGSIHQLLTDGIAHPADVPAGLKKRDAMLKRSRLANRCALTGLR